MENEALETELEDAANATARCTAAGLLNRKNSFDSNSDSDSECARFSLSSADSADSGSEVLHRMTCYGVVLRSCAFRTCLYMVLALLLVVAVVTLITVCALVVLPYTRVSSLVAATCQSVHLSRSPHLHRCSCGRGCTSTHPCLRINVHLVDKNVTTALLYDNEIVMRRQCSFYPVCKSSGAENALAVREYEREFGSPGRTFACLFDPRNPRVVIRTRRFRLAHVVHGLLWSALLLVAAVAALVYLALTRGCRLV